MSLQQLKYFLVMSEVLHYTKAANRLYISQPSLSYSISELEKELGAPLFERQGKHTRLTKFGEEFLPYVRRALDELNEGQNRLLQMLDPATGTVNLGYIYSISFDYIPKTLASFFQDQHNSNITFSFFQGMNLALIEKLMDRSLDLAFAVDPGDTAIMALPVFAQPLYVILPQGHPLESRGQLTLDDIRDEPLVTINNNSSLRAHVDRCFASINAKPKVVFEVAECNAMAAFVNSKMGIAITPRIPSLESYQVRVLPVCDNALNRDICLLWLKNGRLTPSATRFRDFIIQQQAQADLS